MKRWFTLIEMLIVIVIIWLLARALLWNVGFFNKDSQLPQKMDLVAKSFDQCLVELDNDWIDIENAKNAFAALFNMSSLNPSDTNLGPHSKFPKWKWFNLTGFFNVVGDKNVCKSFIWNLNNNVGKKWSVEVWCIPANVNWNVKNYIDADYGGFLVCATSSSKKYSEFQDANRSNKYYTCAILSLWMKSTWKKWEVLRAFWGNNKVLKTNETSPTIPTSS
jgi:type II secretory pathway pseudopilin PulG